MHVSIVRHLYNPFNFAMDVMLLAKIITLSEKKNNHLLKLSIEFLIPYFDVL